MFERDTQTVFTRNCYQQVMVDAATQMVRQRTCTCTFTFMLSLCFFRIRLVVTLLV